MCIRNLLKELNIVSDLTLVCQDWGGLVGLSVVKVRINLFIFVPFFQCKKLFSGNA